MFGLSVAQQFHQSSEVVGVVGRKKKKTNIFFMETALVWMDEDTLTPGHQGMENAISARIMA